MTHPAYIREKARELRKSKKLTIDELAQHLALSRSTIYYWVRDVPVKGSGPGGEFQTAAQQLGTRAMQAKYRRLREDAYAAGHAEFSRLARDPTFRDFICLYMGEGYKRSRHVVAICNSDPEIMKLAGRWIRRLTANKVDYGIQWHADQDLRELVEFWGAELGVEPGCIRLQRKSNSNRLQGRNWRSRYGVLTVRTCDTQLRARLQAWIDSVRDTWV